jgi:membrane protein YqaA with SNARE-associated domain
MRSLARWVIGTFASPAGIVALGALDSTILFSMPFGIDGAVIILAVRSKELAWSVPILATLGSIAGAALTFWMGVKIGEQGLERYVPPKRLERVRSRVKQSGAIALASLTLVPPPFPFTPFLLAAGALEVRTVTFFSAYAVSRLIRFGAEAYLATRYGRRILTWLDSPDFEGIVLACVVLTVLLTALTIFKLARGSRSPRQATA